MRTVVVSRGPSAAFARGARIRPAAPAAAMPPTKPRRVWISGIAHLPLGSRLELALEFVEESRVGAIGDDLVRVGFDQPDLVQAEGIVADGVLGIVFAPFVVRQLAQRLTGIVVSRGEPALDEPLRGTSGVGGAEIDGFEDGARRAFGRDGTFPHEFPAAAQHAAEILRPRTVDCAVDDDVSDMPGPQLLGLRRKAQKGVGLAVYEKLHRLDRRGGDDPVDILLRVDSDLS